MANCVSVMKKKCCLCFTSPSLAMAGEPGKRHDVRAHYPEVVSDWLNPLSLWTMSASAYIDNLAEHSTSLINYRELNRSI